MRAIGLSVKLAALGFGLLLGATETAHAQYFGPNKVRYTERAFEVLSSQHFDVYIYPEEQAAADLVTRMAER
jgi:hypothetical protein